jgi:hypothetical protein
MKTIAIGVMMIGMVLACQNTSVTPLSEQKNATDRKGIKEGQAANHAQAAKPPIDLAVPFRIETATFALG